MGNTCIGTPRKNGVLMKKGVVESRYESKTANEKKYLSAVVGENEGNKLKIKRNLIACSICMQNYNTTDRQPQLVCPNNHTYCKECTAQISAGHRKCPECRLDMRAPVRNRDLFQLVQDNQVIMRQNKLEQIDEDVGNGRVVLSVNTKHNSLIHSFWVRKDRVMKIENNKIWEGFSSQEILPNDKDSYFTVRVLSTEFANIEIGIVGAGYKCEKNITCKEAVVYHLSDGMILQGGRGEASEWRGQGHRIKLEKGASIQITCRVSPARHTVTWLHGEQMLAQGTFSNYLKQNTFVAYVMLCHKGDTIELNT